MLNTLRLSLTGLLLGMLILAVFAMWPQFFFENGQFFAGKDAPAFPAWVIPAGCALAPLLTVMLGWAARQSQRAR